MADETRGLILQLSATTTLMQSQLAEAERSIQQFDKQAEVSTRRVEQNFKRVGASAGAMRSGFQQLSFQLGDIAQGFAMGTRPMTIFAQQSGQVIQALTLMGGGTNKFLALLGGPWGQAFSIAAVALSPFIAKLFETGKTADETKGKIEGLAKAVKSMADLSPYVQDLVTKQGELAALQGKLDRGTPQGTAFFAQTLEGKRIANEIKVLKSEITSAQNFIDLYSRRVATATNTVAQSGRDAPSSPRTSGRSSSPRIDAAKEESKTFLEIFDEEQKAIIARQKQTQEQLSPELQAMFSTSIADGIVKGWQEGQKAAADVQEEINRRQEGQIQNLARLFENGFRGGTQAIWKDFKDIGLAVISQVLAKFVAGNISGGGGGFNLGSAFSSALGSIFGGGFANGGNPPVGKVSLVGERGPELIMPRTPMTVIPNGGFGGGSSTVNVEINAPGATAETVAVIRREILMAAPKIVQAAQTATMRTMTRPALGR